LLPYNLDLDGYNQEIKKASEKQPKRSTSPQARSKSLIDLEDRILADEANNKQAPDTRKSVTFSQKN